MITELAIRDLGPFENAVFKFYKGLNIVTGTNHVGKTTIKNMAYFALSGEVIDRPAESYINFNKKSTSPQVMMSTDRDGLVHILTRTLTPHSLILNNEPVKIDHRSKKDELTKHGYNKQQLSILCNNSNFFDSKAAEQYKVLSSYFTSMAIIHPTEHNGITADEEKELPVISLENIDAMYQKYYEERTQVNRQIAAANATIASLHETVSMFSPGNKTLDSLQQERNAIALQVRPFPRRDSKYAVEIAKIRGQIEELKRQQFKFSGEAEATKIAAEGFRNKGIADGIKNANGNCPICPDIKCGDIERLKAKMVELEANNTELRVKFQELNKQKSDEEKAFEENRQAQIQELDKTLKGFFMAEEKDRIEYQKICEGVSAENEKVRVQLAAFDSEIATYAKVDMSRKNLLAQQASLEKSKARLVTLEKFVAFFGKNGIKNSIATMSGAEFIKRINEISALFGFVYSLENSEDGFAIKINGRYSYTFSPSEKMMASIALQYYIAMSSGYKFLFVDPADILDFNHFPQLINIIRQATDLTTIIVGTDLLRFDILRQVPANVIRLG